jgi:Ca2+-binding EF-hand superfamily protein
MQFIAAGKWSRHTIWDRIHMRPFLLGLAILMLPASALAQEGFPGEGGGGGREGEMRGGQRGGGDGERGMGRPGGRPAEAKPVSREKMVKPVEEMFQAADTNKDGFVTLDELRAVLDSKRDATIRERFKKIDTNGDKVIDEKEFVAWQAAMGTVAVSDVEARGAGFGIVQESLSPSWKDGRDDQILRAIIEPLSATVLVNANTNYDKGVTLEELLAYEYKRFDSADLDKDGQLYPQELRSLRPDGGPRVGGGMRPADGGGMKPPPGGGAPSD